MDHKLVPKHELVPKEMAEEVLKSYGVKAEKLPAILSDDPLVKELKAERGDLIKIIRESKIAGRAICYRLVI